ncbi:MAG: hypothetical protein Q7R32_02530 [Dehalococcoidia bacterium]|nr:hypothetical protein [Dehalococcoidia bacterium]
MTRDEFGKRLQQLMKEIVIGLLYYAAWARMYWHEDKDSWSLAEQNKALGSFGEFLTPVASALNGMALMQFAKVLDKDKNARTASLATLLNAAQQKPELLPNRMPADLNTVAQRLKQSESIVTKLRRVRNQKLAHANANPGPLELMKKDFDGLIDEIKSAFDCLSIGYGRPRVAWDFPVKGVERDGSELMRVLVREVRDGSL